MSEGKSKDAKSIKREWNERSKAYDNWDETFEGRVGRYVDWKLLKSHLPRDKSAKILDAAGGTGVITLPLAKAGYNATLCDISSGMLDVARQKLLKDGVLDKAKITECDVRHLPFSDETFDFVLCWAGPTEALKELVRVTRKKGKISFTVKSRYWASVSKFPKEPELALKLVESKMNH
jgi:ubiquinone/menaquinone biosynthesis C-methylase UbiE